MGPNKLSLCTFHQFPLTSTLLGPNKLFLCVLFTNSLLLPPFWAQIKFLFMYFSPISSYFRPFGPKRTSSLCPFHQFPLTSALLGPKELSLYVLFTNSLLLPPFWAQINFLFMYFSPIPSYFRSFWAQMSSPRHPFHENLQPVIPPPLHVRSHIKQYQTYGSVFINLCAEYWKAEDRRF